ncbi:MAG: 2Fe-2S iron-sulfur cluster-binding protein [Bacteroidota bacterium]|nr:2Fe-2S iron-sulfur cluster binding domain-containing protein [Flavisolibacter sp.]MBD0368962.1 2Fe-2S iron-sulfur cluster binding domain-containing protein [Flavisolibacter sp.]MDQ3842787.1 2Fe-2S iron-sulfur cluster-binding protein [Bacteroidota bacterium]
MYTIKFNFEQNGLRPVVLKNVKGGKSILEIALKHSIELHHDCGGVCACSTCHVFIEKGMSYFEEKSKRETDFLRKVKNAKTNSRLSCQCLLLNGSGAVEVLLPDQSI